MSRRHQRTQRSGDPLSLLDHDRQAYVPLHPVSTPIQSTSTALSSSSTGACHTVKRMKPKVATYGIRKDNTSVFKANPRRHEFVVFNIPRVTEVYIVKQYIASNNVDVMDIVRLSKDDWSNKSFCFCVSYDHIEKVKVSDFWPELLLFAFRDLWKEWGDSNFHIFSQNCQSSNYQIAVPGSIGVVSFSDISLSPNVERHDHGKSAADGLSAVVKHSVTHAVTHWKVLVRNAKELLNYCEEHSTDVGISIAEGT